MELLIITRWYLTHKLMTEKTIKEGKTMAIVAYLTLIGTLIAFFINLV